MAVVAVQEHPNPAGPPPLVMPGLEPHIQAAPSLIITLTSALDAQVESADVAKLKAQSLFLVYS